MPQPRPNRSRSAFTLIEVLIAVAIFAIVLAAINTVFYGAMRLRNKTSQGIEASVPVERAVAIMTRDLEGIMPPGGRLAGTMSSGGTGSSTPVQTPGMDVRSSFEFYTATGVLNETLPWGDIQKIAYYLKTPTNLIGALGKDLVRGITRNLLASTQDQPEEQWLMSDVAQLEFAFHNGTDWRETWDSTTEQSPLPKAIRVSVQLARDETSALTDTNRLALTPIQFVVPIVIQARTNAAQSSTSGGGE